MARLIGKKLAISAKEEIELVEVLVGLHLKNSWDENCRHVQRSFLEWVLIYRDSVDQLFDYATRHKIKFVRFATDNPSGYPGDTVKLKGLSPEWVEQAKIKHNRSIIYRRSRLIMEKATQARMTTAEINSCFPTIQHGAMIDSERIDQQITFLGETILEMHKDIVVMRNTITEFREELERLRGRNATGPE